MGIDINEGNITMTDNEGNTGVISTKALKTTYVAYQNIRRRVRAVKSLRTRAKLLAKCRSREKYKIRDVLRELFRAVVMMCQGKGVVLESLKGIKRRDKGRKLNRRLNNSWNPR